MARKEGQKAKILVLLEILQQHSDENHRLTVPMIEKMLAKQGVPCERKSVYTDIAALEDAGYAIDLVRGPGGGYYLESRTFELPELEILVDAVQNSRFITEKKSNALIKKLSGFASNYQASSLARQVFISGRVKSMNESVYYNVDALHRAIAHNQMVKFTYWKHDVNKRKVQHIDKDTQKARYEISPWALAYENGNYYLIAYQTYSEPFGIRHYRVDKMKNVAELDATRLGQAEYQNFDLAAYTKMTFNMFHGTDERVTLRCKNGLMDAMIDRFGSDFIQIEEAGGTHFHFDVPISVSAQFFGWVCGFGGGVEIAAPAHVKEKMKVFLETLSTGY